MTETQLCWIEQLLDLVGSLVVTRDCRCRTRRLDKGAELVC